MTNPPITSSNPQSLARGASTTQVSGMPDMKTVESFGGLLAQQMEEAGTPALIAPSSAIAIETEATTDYAKLTGKVDQDKILAATGISGDPASALATMLQPPPEDITSDLADVICRHGRMTATNNLAVVFGQPTQMTNSFIRGQKTEDRQTTQPPVLGFFQSEEDNPQRTTGELLRADMMQQTDCSVISPLSSEAAKRVELAAGLTQPTQNTAQLITLPTISAVMQNMPASNRPADATQTIATPLGNSDWTNEFSQRINWMSTQHHQVAELHLNPPDLGPLNVVLKISDNQATALFASPHSAVRDAVENALPKLRETLADNGITLGNTTVSDQPPRDRDMEKFMSQDSSGTATRRDISGEANSLMAAAQIAPARRHNGMVDTFA